MPEFLKVNGRVLHYRLRQGSAKRPIVFANSLGTDLRIWDRVIDMLPSDVPVLTYDKSGHGLSQAGAPTIEDLASDLAALMDALNLHEALVCGVSVGGMIAQAMASHRSDLVAGLVLCNTSYRIGSRQSWTERIDMLDEHGLDAMADGILERWFSDGFRQARPDIVAGYGAMLTRTPLDGYRQVCAAIGDADLTTRTSQIGCPTICVAGSNDQATPPEVVRAMSDLIGESTYVCLDGVGHLPCVEVPDRLASIITDQLRTLP